MENEFQLYSKLLSLPLFQGFGKADLGDVVAHTKFDFHKYEPEETIIDENENCNHLMFLLNGIAEVVTIAADHCYQIIEDISSPEILQPERLFGLIQNYTKTFKAKTTCRILRIDKNEVMRLSDNYMIFRINIMNMLSTVIQKQERQLLRKYPENLEGRIIKFISDRCLRPAGRKIINIKMTQLAKEINDSRLDVSKALNRMEEMGILELKRGYIYIGKIETAMMQTQKFAI